VLALLNALLDFRPQGRGSDLSLALRTACESLQRRGICFVVSDFKTGAYWHELSLMARRHDVIAARVFDPADVDFPEVGTAELEDPESGASLIADGLASRFRREYRDFRDEQVRLWREECRKRGVETLSLATSDDPWLKLLDFFRRRRRR
jgi:uncharacterized protein (DUF58 family)